MLTFTAVTRYRGNLSPIKPPFAYCNCLSTLNKTIVENRIQIVTIKLRNLWLRKFHYELVISLYLDSAVRLCRFRIKSRSLISHSYSKRCWIRRRRSGSHLHAERQPLHLRSKRALKQNTIRITKFWTGE